MRSGVDNPQAVMNGLAEYDMCSFGLQRDSSKQWKEKKLEKEKWATRWLIRESLHTF